MSEETLASINLQLIEKVEEKNKRITELEENLMYIDYRCQKKYNGLYREEDAEKFYTGILLSIGERAKQALNKEG